VLSGGGDRIIRLWDIQSGSEIRRFEGHTFMVNSVCFSPDGRYALSGSDDATIRLWDIASGMEIRRFKGHSTGCVCFSPNGKFALSGSSDNIWFWEIFYPVKNWNNHPYPVTSSIKQIIELIEKTDKINGMFKTIEENVNKGFYFKAYQLLKKIQSFPDYEYDMNLLNLVTKCGIEGKGRRVNLKRCWNCFVFKGHTKSVTSVCFSPDGRYVLSGSDDKTIRLWGIANSKELKRFEGHTSTVTNVCFSPDGRYVLSGSDDKTIRLWSIENSKELKRFEGHNVTVNSVCFSPDGRYILSGSGNFWSLEGSTLLPPKDNSIRFWNIESGKEIKRFEGHTKEVTSVCFSPDGRYALSGSVDETIRFWEIKTGKEIRKFEGHTSGVAFVCFSSDGRYLLSRSSDKTIRLWEIKTGKEIRKFEGHNNYITSVCFSPDGRYVLSGSVDNTIRLWDIETGHEKKRFESYIDKVSSDQISPDGRYLLFTKDYLILLWELDWDWEFDNYKQDTQIIESSRKYKMRHGSILNHQSQNSWIKSLDDWIANFFINKKK
jgi:WD40 repeat protein